MHFAPSCFYSEANKCIFLNTHAHTDNPQADACTNTYVFTKSKQRAYWVAFYVDIVLDDVYIDTCCFSRMCILICAHACIQMDRQ